MTWTTFLATLMLGTSEERASFAVECPLMSMWIETSHDDTYYIPSAFPCNITSPIPEEKAVYQMVFFWDQNLPNIFCKSRL